MPNQPHPDGIVAKIRFRKDDWQELEELTQLAGTDRSSALRDFARWYMRRPGAKLPPRPAGEQAKSRTP